MSPSNLKENKYFPVRKIAFLHKQDLEERKGENFLSKEVFFLIRKKRRGAAGEYLQIETTVKEGKDFKVRAAVFNLTFFLFWNNIEICQREMKKVCS